jgi:hypothetical protein
VFRRGFGKYDGPIVLVMKVAVISGVASAASEAVSVAKPSAFWFSHHSAPSELRAL